MEQWWTLVVDYLSGPQAVAFLRAAHGREMDSASTSDGEEAV